eukprot:COSAG01_NODE_5796_length_4030_cov_20.163317_3_plen_641_part_00
MERPKEVEPAANKEAAAGGGGDATAPEPTPAPEDGSGELMQRFRAVARTVHASMVMKFEIEDQRVREIQRGSNINHEIDTTSSVGKLIARAAEPQYIGRQRGLRYITKNMEMLREKPLNADGGPWDGTGEPWVAVFDLQMVELQAILRSVLSPNRAKTTAERALISAFDAASMDGLLSEVKKYQVSREKAGMEQLSVSEDFTGDLKPIRGGSSPCTLVRGALLCCLYWVPDGDMRCSLINCKDESVSYVNGGIRKFSCFDFDGEASSLPVLSRVPPRELQTLRQQAQTSSRWQQWRKNGGFDHDLIHATDAGMTNMPPPHDIDDDDELPHGLWILQVVAMTTTGHHPYFRLIDPNGLYRVIGYGYMDLGPPKPPMSVMNFGRLGLIDPNERVPTPRRVTNLPISHREARHVMDAVLSYQRRLVAAARDPAGSDNSAVGYQFINQNCSDFVSGILAEVLEIPATEELELLLPTKPAFHNYWRAVLCCFPNCCLNSCATVCSGACQGATSDRFRRSVLQLDRNQPLPSNEKVGGLGWDGDLRHVEALRPMVTTILELFSHSVFGHSRWQSPNVARLQRWQEYESSTEMLPQGGPPRKCGWPWWCCCCWAMCDQCGAAQGPPHIQFTATCVGEDMDRELSTQP